MKIVDVQQELTELKQLVVILIAENTRLHARVAELESQLGQNSKNSHQPPSGDKPYDKPSPKPAFPKPDGKNKGGQPGHEGGTLKMTGCPNKLVFHDPETCKCGASLSAAEGAITERRQVFDMPAPRLEVTEHAVREKICICGCRNIGIFPENVKAPVQYGVGVNAFVVLLSTHCHLSYNKICELFNDLFDYKINVSTVVSQVKRCYTALEATENLIKEKILSSPCVHFDETGMKGPPKLIWLHSAGTPKLTFQFVHLDRGNKAMRSEQSLLPYYTGTAVHDCLRSYFSFDNCGHAICGAHLLRELNGLIENGSKWATSFHKFLMMMYRVSDKGSSVLKHQDWFERIYDVICAQADGEEPQAVRTTAKQGCTKSSKGRKLLNRLKKHKDSVLAFIKQSFIPFTNNQAERDVRPCKGKIKIAGAFRTFQGAKEFARIQGCISTFRKQNLNTFKELKKSLSTQNYQTVLNT